jgi:death-on-curing protein
MEPIWLSRAAVDAIHDDQRQLNGGNPGVLNDGGIESALFRPRNRFDYTGADLFECAASYIFGLAKNHGYQDANKRTAFASGLTFLRVNGFRIDATPEDVIRLMLDVATDALAEPAIAEWLRTRAVQL